MCGRRAGEFPCDGSELLCDGSGVDLLDPLARQYQRAAVDIRRSQASRAVCIVDEGAQPVRVDGVIGEKGRKQDRRAPEDVAAHHHELARQQLSLALQMDPGEHQMRGRAADVDAYRGQLDVIGLPDDLGQGAFRLLGPFVEMRFVVVVRAHGPWTHAPQVR